MRPKTNRLAEMEQAMQEIKDLVVACLSCNPLHLYYSAVVQGKLDAIKKITEKAFREGEEKGRDVRQTFQEFI